MKALYLETSALLSWFFEQAKTEQIIAVIDRSAQVITSIISILEAKRAFARLEKTKEISPSPRVRLLQSLERNAMGWEVMGISPQIQQRISEPFPIEPVRTLDAIHLASALETAKIFPDCSVLTLDSRIISNLEPLGLEIAKI